MSSTLTLLLACILPLVGLVLLVGGVFFLKSEMDRPKLNLSDWIHHEDKVESNLRDLRVDKSPQDSSG